MVADVTERRQAEDRQRFLLEELNHRIKNVLSTVQAVATSTVRTSASLADFERAFAGRLNALARTYTLLAAAEWRTTELRSLVEEAVAPYRAADGGNVSLSGNDIRLPANTALPLSPDLARAGDQRGQIRRLVRAGRPGSRSAGKPRK